MDNHHVAILAEPKAGGWLARAKAHFWIRQDDQVTPRTIAWWHALLCTIAVLNIAAWSLSAIAVTHTHTAHPVAADGFIQLQLWLSAGYVFGCAFRSVLPVYDIPRAVLVDCRLSSVIVGRSVATIAELCFATQWALILHRLASLSHNPFAAAVSQLIVPLIVIAEGCSWYAVLTTAQRAHAAENSIWGVCAALMVVALLLMEPHRVGGLHPLLMIWCAGGAAYVAYIFLADVPAYWSRWRADQRSAHLYLTIGQGVIDVWRRRIVSYRWETWKDEVLWMSLYFTFGVWSSVSIVYASIMLSARVN